MRHSITLFMLAALAVMAPRDVASQRPATPNAVGSRSSDAIDALFPGLYLVGVVLAYAKLRACSGT